MRALPPETAFRTDTSLLWMALVARIVAHKQAILSLLPSFPRRPGAHDVARFARLLQDTLQAGLAQPSRLLTYYLKRLTQHEARPLAPVEVLWQLAAELHVPLYDEEQQQGAALRQAIDAVWMALSASPKRFIAFSRTALADTEQHSAYRAVLEQVITGPSTVSAAEAADLLQHLLGWLQATVPAITALIDALESTQIHTLLTVHDDLSLTRPPYLKDEAMVTQLHHLLSSSLRPARLHQGELLSPMEATIYHQPEPGAPPFVEIGEEIKVGQTLALLEAMKMFTELPSPVDGVLVAILVETGQGVKTGTPLFRIATQDTVMTTGTDVSTQSPGTVFENRFGLLLPEVENKDGS